MMTYLEGRPNWWLIAGLKACINLMMVDDVAKFGLLESVGVIIIISNRGHINGMQIAGAVAIVTGAM